MPQYLGQSQFDHASTQRLGVLLVNLGTPDAPTPAAVRRFLAEFLRDPRVVETPRWIWWLALHGVILRIRPRRSAHAYQQIWTTEGSPLLIHCRQLAAKLQTAVNARLGSNAQVALGMSYGNPAIPAALEQLHRDGVRRLIVLPLYPQYSGTTTASVFDPVTSVLQRWRWLPETRFIGGYHDEPGYIAAVADSIREHWRTQERRHLLFSFHGAPRAYLEAGDPYHCQCLKTARLIADNLGLQASEWTATFQSRLGRGEWLRPYTDETLQKFAGAGPKRITIVCPGFPVDNLETLEENAIRNRADFLAAGGEAFDYIPALNASDTHTAFLADLVARHAQGWPESSGGAVVDPNTQQRAKRAGAVRSMLGRFLEISIHTPVIQESLEFYQSLGFQQASVGETWPYPYAVVTDGHLFIGLHGAVIRSPALTFVLPELAAGVEKLREQGVSFDQERLGSDVFNQVTFTDPSGQAVNILEARTFSPPSLDALASTTCGYFTEFGIPVRNATASREFWEPLGFVALEEESDPFPRSAITSDLLNLGLYRTRTLRQPVLTFEDPDMRERLTRLRERGFTLSDEMPDSLDDATNAILEAPEGTRLLLLQSER